MTLLRPIDADAALYLSRRFLYASSSGKESRTFLLNDVQYGLIVQRCMIHIHAGLGQLTNDQLKSRRNDSIQI